MKRAFIFYAAALILSFLASPLYAAPRAVELSDERDEEIKDELTKPPESLIQKVLHKKEDIKKKYGTSIAVLFDYQQQIIVGGDKRGRGKAPWYYNVEVQQDLWKGAWLVVDLEGGGGKGIDNVLHTVSGFDSNSGEISKAYVPYLMLGQNFFDDNLYFAGGKIDLSDWFDMNTVANSADTQFTSPALINNNTIPFPQKGLGFVAGAWFLDWAYAQVGISNADAKSTAWKTNNLKHPFIMAEAGIAPQFKGLKGNYRFMLRFNRQKMDQLYNESDTIETRYGDMGEALSFDQQITQKITLFLKYGHANEKVRSVANSWSTGFEIAEPIPGRKYDVYAFGVAQSIMGSDARRAADPKLARTETMFETYYSIAINEVVSFSPDIQVVMNPNATKDSPTAVVLNGRLLVLF